MPICEGIYQLYSQSGTGGCPLRGGGALDIISVPERAQSERMRAILGQRLLSNTIKKVESG